MNCTISPELALQMQRMVAFRILITHSPFSHAHHGAPQGALTHAAQPPIYRHFPTYPILWR
jgi:hypothetical protein